ncbi:hypothetical protein D9757_007556 [Collybiopsis confluens]|uniref:Uncharacterized protein n=1 Tax=Collybiopsis confluens TaxID=2823264 RepID=A0A8H5HES0_9AGAR|nr:hypothetical protein D9757_007556 [Collybiopsis confluens]
MNRWLLVEFIPTPSFNNEQSPQTNFDAKQIYAALKQSIISHFGDVGWGAVGLSLTVKYYSPVTNICIIRVGRDQHKIAWGGLTLLESVQGVRCIPYVIHLSGTIKHAQLAAITHNRQVIARYRAKAKAPAAYRDSYESYLESSTQEIEAMQD